jgi:hypothetical protein
MAETDFKRKVPKLNTFQTLWDKTPGSGLPILCHGINGNGVVCDQKSSKFFVSHVEESIAGHMGKNGVY